MTAQITSVLAGSPRVNLIPRSEIERRERAGVLRRWAWALVGALALLAAIVAGAVFLNWAAQQRLAAEQSATNELLSQLSELSDVSVALTTQQDLEQFRALAMSTDLEWRSLYATLASGLPGGVVLTGFDLAVGAAPEEGADPATVVGLEGGLTFQSADPVDIAPLIRSYRALEGVITADGAQVLSEEGEGPPIYTYELVIEFDQSLYTGAYAQEAEN